MAHKYIREYEIFLQEKASDNPNDFRTVEFVGCSNYREGVKEAKRLSARCPFEGSNGETIVNVELVCRQSEVDEFGDVWDSVEIFYDEFTDGKYVGRYKETARGWDFVPVKKKARPVSRKAAKPAGPK